MRQLVTCRHKIIKTEISKSLQIAVLRTKVYARALRPYQAKHLDEISVRFIFRLKPHAPVAQKVADEVVFRRFQVEGVEFFFKSDLTDPPPLRFLMRIYWKIPI